MEEKNLETIRETIAEIVKKMGFESQVEIQKETQNDEENIVFNVKIEGDSNLLIGQYGVNLRAFQHLVRLIARKKMEEKTNFIIDVNSYCQQKKQSIIEQAYSAAQQAVSEKRAVVMKPMSAYERRIVHLELAKNDEVVTESAGEGENRKIIVKPAGIIA